MAKPKADPIETIEYQMYWILDEYGEPVPAGADEFSKWFGSSFSERTVAMDDVDEDLRVSTVFLGINHGMIGEEPILFETMVFGGPLDGECRRYTTRDKALAGHARLLARVLKHYDPVCWRVSRAMGNDDE